MMNRKKKIILALIIAVIAFIIFRPKRDRSSLYIKVKKSDYLNRKGERGLFATKNYKAGDVIENCPTLKIKKTDVAEDNILHDHFFESSKNKKNYLLSLGYCSIINHSEKNQNCTWDISDDDNVIIMRAIKNIRKGEEIFSSYGEKYWEERKTQIKK